MTRIVLRIVLGRNTERGKRNNVSSYSSADQIKVVPQVPGAFGILRNKFTGEPVLSIVQVFPLFSMTHGASQDLTMT